VTWLKNGVPLPSDDRRVQARTEGLHYTLSIREPTTTKDEGLYTIKIDNDDKESSCQVTVEDLAGTEKKKPHIIRQLQDVTVPERSSLRLECEFEGDDVEASWYLNGVKIQQNSFTTIDMKNDVAKLTIKEVYTEDGGIYKLRLRNPYGEVSTSATVYIKLHGEDTWKLSTDEMPPKFLEPISDVFVHDGQNAHFRAVISGHPAPKVTWY
ncbi:unnamed protein product, partial [Didymodactylos carnosus]